MALTPWLILHNQLVQTKFGSFKQYMYYSHVPSLLQMYYQQ